MGTVMTELGARPEPPASRGRLVVAAVLLVLTLLASVFVGLAAWGATQDLADVREDVDTMAGPALATDLVIGLQDERNYAAIYILGAENALVLPVDSMDEATGNTDQALAAFRSQVERQGGDLADAYGPVLGGIDDSLADLRQSVGEVTGERSVRQRSVSDRIYDGYTTLVEDLLGAGDSMALAIDDPELRQGAQLRTLATAQPELVGRIARELVFAGVGPGGSVDTAEEVATISADKAELEANEAEIENLATGVYEEVAGDQEDGAALSEFLDVVDTSVEGGPVPLAEVLSALGSPTSNLSEHNAAMSDAVKTTLAERADDIEHQAESRRLLWFVLAGASAAAVVLALVVLVR
jgi:Nitrate and nitrite sensing